jgi:hypothetical protein
MGWECGNVFKGGGIFFFFFFFFFFDKSKRFY